MEKQLNTRIILTTIWFITFFVLVLIIELYTKRTVSCDNINALILLEENRLPAMKSIFILYGSYISTILGFWFKKPFKNLTDKRIEKIRKSIALFCTIFFNGWILYMVGRGHFYLCPNIQNDIDSAMKIAGWCSIIVLPINAYYFGSKNQTEIGID